MYYTGWMYVPAYIAETTCYHIIRKYHLQYLSLIHISLNYYGTSMESVESRTAETFRFSHPAVKQLEDGSYVANDIDIKGEDALSYYDRMTLISEAGIYDSGFLKLRELSVSYPIWDKNGINVNLNVFARNIILWSELKGLDPEASQGNNNMGGGFERFSMPGASSYGFGLNVKF